MVLNINRLVILNGSEMNSAAQSYLVSKVKELKAHQIRGVPYIRPKILGATMLYIEAKKPLGLIPFISL
uniref:30S ribosomal protein S8 n=1 Tax=Heterorhabditis bacteriophora TaxID=37862 RepID=A0A1I7XF23_HETBA